MSKPIDPKVLVIDVESTCWELPERPGPNEMSEIIEIGITVVDTHKLQIQENECIMIKPQTSKVSKFCTALTTLTQADVDLGLSFPDAMKLLREKFHSETRTMVSWGDYDRKMFEKNSRHHNLKYPFGPRHMNLKNTFTTLHGLACEPGMDTALKLIGLELEGTHHRGVDDARNIAKILLHTLKQFRSKEQVK